MSSPSVSWPPKPVLLERTRGVFLCVVSTFVCWAVLGAAGRYAMLVHQVRALSCGKPGFPDKLIALTHDSAFALRGLLVGLAFMLAVAGLFVCFHVVMGRAAPFRMLCKVQVLAVGLALGIVAVFTTILLAYHRTPFIPLRYLGEEYDALFTLGLDGGLFLTAVVALVGCLTILLRAPAHRALTRSTFVISLGLLSVLWPLQGVLNHESACMVAWGRYVWLFEWLIFPCLLGPVLGWIIVTWRTYRRSRASLAA